MTTPLIPAQPLVSCLRICRSSIGAEDLALLGGTKHNASELSRRVSVRLIMVSDRMGTLLSDDRGEWIISHLCDLTDLGSRSHQLHPSFTPAYY